MPSTRIQEALWAIRDKPVESTTLERLRITREADELVRGRPQVEQLGWGLRYLLDRVSLPVAQHDLLLGRVAETVPNADEEAYFQETVSRWDGQGTPAWMPDGGHEALHWERILRVGLPGMQTFAENEAARRRAAGETGPHLDWLDGAVQVYEAHRNYARRYAAAARDAGLTAQAERCAAIADRPPQTFAEALQLIWLIAQVYCTFVARNPTLTLGRLDHLLLSFYQRDLAAGTLTRNEAGDFVEDFYAKNNLILGRGEHQMDGGSGKATGWARNLAYDAPQYVLLAGRVPDGSPATNELTELFVERIVPAFENPVIILRYTRDFPEPLWLLACEKMRGNASMLVYNDEVVIDSHRRLGIPEALAIDYSLYGCNWPIVSAKPRSPVTQRLVVPRHLLEALGEVESDAAMDDLYEAFRRALADHLAKVYAEREQWRSSCDERAPGPLAVDACFLDGPIARARHWALDPDAIAVLTFGIVGLATAADSLAAVEHVAFSGHGQGLEAIRESLARDFQSAEDLRQLCLHAPKFGQNDARADAHAVRTLGIVLEEIDRASQGNGHGPLRTFRSLTSDMTHRGFGRDLGATPDGRRAGEPLSENMSPSPGSCTDGLSSMLQSLAKLPFEGIQSGVLNIRIDPKTVAGEEGLAKLAATLRTYFDMGGLQCQLSFANVDELRAAQQNPETHRDLMVRITGYSAVFVDMAEHAQDEFIRRAEMGI